MNQTLKDVSAFSFLLLIFIFIYGLWGREWFAYNVKFTDDYKIDLNSPDSTYQDSNFNTIYDACLSVFLSITGDSWTDIYYKQEAGVNYFASIFFLSLTFFG